MFYDQCLLADSRFLTNHEVILPEIMLSQIKCSVKIGLKRPTHAMVFGFALFIHELTLQNTKAYFRVVR